MSSKQDDILHRLEDIDNSFLLAMEDDERLRSGVPEQQRATDLDFIQMTGLTRRSPEEDIAASPKATPAGQTVVSGLSFFEKGVADVDAEMAPRGLEQAAHLNQDIVPESLGADRPIPAVPSIAGLREVIEELAQEERASAQEADRVPLSELTMTEALAEEEPEMLSAEPVMTADATVPDAGPGMAPGTLEDAVEQAYPNEPLPVGPSSLEPVEWVHGETLKEKAEELEGFVPLSDAGSPDVEPPGLEQTADLNQDIVPESLGADRPIPAVPSIAGLREVIEELAQEEGALAQEADRVPLSELTMTEALAEEEPETLSAEPVMTADATVPDAGPGMAPGALEDAVAQAHPNEPLPVGPSSLEPVEWVHGETLKEKTEELEGFVLLSDAGSPDAEPPAERPGRPPAEHMLDLAEAGHLLQALESQPRQVGRLEEDRLEEDRLESLKAPLASSLSSSSLSVEPAEEQDATEESELSVYHRAMPRHRRRPVHRQPRGWRRVARWAARLAVVLILACVAAGGYKWFRPMFATPRETLEQARALQEAGRYSEASGVYQSFAQAQPDHPQRAEAEFLAAYCLQLALAPSDSYDARQANNERAYNLFARFVADNPAHAKVPRARVRMGILSFEMGRYEEAIETLQDPTLPMSDPEGALPALRTLARARRELGQYAEAASAYQQAASLSGNYTADQDYEELGDLCRWQADHTENAEEQRRLHMNAVENWTKALRMPTADPSVKGKIREKRRWLLEQLGMPGDDADQAYQVAAPVKAALPAASPASQERAATEAAPREQENAPSLPAAPPQPSPAASAAPDPNAEAHYPGGPLAPEKPEPSRAASGPSSS
jgi:tetratricopeptide (TPR) repeat protein